METFDFYIKQLPLSVQTKILRYRNWQDAQRSLLGKVLLMHGLNALKLNKTLAELKVTNLEKPYFDDKIHFNIAHSGKYVICAISLTNRIGVDVEEIKPIPLNDFINNFSEKEWKEIVMMDKNFYGFYKYWTQKEAFLKAIGMGLNIPLKLIETINNKIIWNKMEWLLEEIELEEGYVAHLCSNAPLPKIIIQQKTVLE